MLTTTITHKITEFAAKLVVLFYIDGYIVIISRHSDLITSKRYSGQAIFMSYLPLWQAVAKVRLQHCILYCKQSLLGLITIYF